MREGIRKVGGVGDDGDAEVLCLAEEPHVNVLAPRLGIVEGRRVAEVVQVPSCHEAIPTLCGQQHLTSAWVTLCCPD